MGRPYRIYNFTAEIEIVRAYNAYERKFYRASAFPTEYISTIVKRNVYGVGTTVAEARKSALRDMKTIVQYEIDRDIEKNINGNVSMIVERQTAGRVTIGKRIPNTVDYESIGQEHNITKKRALSIFDKR